MKTFIKLTTVKPFPAGGTMCNLPHTEVYVIRNVEAFRKYLNANKIEHKIEILNADLNTPLT